MKKTRWTRVATQARGASYVDWVWLDFRVEQGHGHGWTLLRDGLWVADFAKLSEAKAAAQRLAKASPT
jgi:hypothetical protein